jgi:hypothetical protein
MAIGIGYANGDVRPGEYAQSSHFPLSYFADESRRPLLIKTIHEGQTFGYNELSENQADGETI